MLPFISKFFINILIGFFVFLNAFGEINIYGPGGPHGAFLKASEEFTKQTGITVNLNYGPDKTWLEKAMKDADFIYGSSEQSTQAILANFPNTFNYKNSVALYYRDSIILVKKGNPKKIKGLKSLGNEGIRVIVVSGAGAANTSGTGLWEDVIGRTKDIDFLTKFKKNIVENVVNSGSARKAFENKEKNIDAFIIFDDWSVILEDSADKVKIEPEYRISRAINITPANNLSEEGRQFLTFLEKDKAADKAFKAYGYYK